MLDDPVGGVLRPGKHYAIFGLQRLAYLGNTAPWFTASSFLWCLSGPAGALMPGSPGEYCKRRASSPAFVFGGTKAADEGGFGPARPGQAMRLPRSPVIDW